MPSHGLRALSCRRPPESLARTLGGPEHVAVGGIVEAAIVARLARERPPYENERGAGEARRLHALADGGERSFDDRLVGPARAPHHRTRAILAENGNELA